MKRRIRVRVSTVIDRDAVSPDSIHAASEYLLGVMVDKAEFFAVAIDWNTFHAYTRRQAGDLMLVHWAWVLR